MHCAVDERAVNAAAFMNSGEIAAHTHASGAWRDKAIRGQTPFGGIAA